MGLLNERIFRISSDYSQESNDQGHLNLEVAKRIKSFEEDLQRDLGLTLTMVDIYDECKGMILKVGVTDILSATRVQEALLPKAKTEEEIITQRRLIQKMLSTFSPSEELVVVDPFIFPKCGDGKNSDAYVSVLIDFLRESVRNLQRVLFVTKPEYCEKIFESVMEALLESYPSMECRCEKSRDFHDRFWIVDRKNGIFVGTSLNGVGKKYCLVDFISPTDVQEIVTALNDHDLLPSTGV